MMPFECYKTYLAMKNHFTKDKYDYHKYCGRSRASLQSFYKRKDRYFFEKMSRAHPDKEIEDYFVANFASCKDPETLWIGEIIKEGDSNFTQWKKKVQSLSYIFKEDVDVLFDRKLDDVFDCSQGHPHILKSYLGGYTTLETLVICDRILGYVKNFDSKLNDPVWQTVSRRIKKYSPFLNINVPQYKKVLREVVINGND
tara:strand:+ start:1294 stop:1890 length:597 start_codon:yes stop_codon:yes gene_type:complete